LVLLSPAAHFDVFTIRMGPQKRVPFLSMAIDQIVLVTGFLGDVLLTLELTRYGVIMSHQGQLSFDLSF
jgi:hypothetical protein